MSLFFIQNPWLFSVMIGLFGLCVGSFLNVVISRLPAMAENAFKKECLESFGKCFGECFAPITEEKPYNLWFPFSHCPICKATLKCWHNIPLISYLFLRGKCAYCQSKIPVRYLLVELISLILSIFLAFKFGPTFILIPFLLLSYCLIAMTFIDLEHQIIPDDLSFPLIWTGLFFNCFYTFVPPQAAILGAMLGYLSFWLIAKLFFLATKKEGLGYGDFKLLAAAGAWLGWQQLPFIILCSSLLAAIVGITFLGLKKLSKDTPIAFGPFLAVAFWIAAIWGETILNYYLRLALWR